MENQADDLLLLLIACGAAVGIAATIARLRLGQEIGGDTTKPNTAHHKPQPLSEVTTVNLLRLAAAIALGGFGLVLLLPIVTVLQVNEPESTPGITPLACIVSFIVAWILCYIYLRRSGLFRRLIHHGDTENTEFQEMRNPKHEIQNKS